MTSGIIIHISVGDEKRTEFFTEDVIRIGSDTKSELQIRTAKVNEEGVWFELALKNGVYRIKTYSERVPLELNEKPIQKFASIKDGDVISIDGVDISFSFFSLKSESSLIVTNRDPHVAQFIEEAALEASVTEKRDDAKAFLREFSRELLREISFRSKVIGLALVVTVLGGIFYLGYGFYQETRQNRLQVEEQNKVINDLKKEIISTNDQIKGLDKSNKDIIKNISLAPNLRVDYGNGICLIVGVYDLVDRKSGRKLRYPDPDAVRKDPYEPAPMEEGMYELPEQQGLTTVGNGSPVEYDFIGTGFHVGNGYIVTNRHVLQPWTEDDLVKQLMRESNGRARIKRLVIYFPGFPNPFPLSVRKASSREDVAIASIDPNSVSSDIPVLPLSAKSDSVAIGKTVVTMGYPNGPDRLLAMVDDREAKSINRKYGNSRQALINFLAQSRKIVPLTTQGAITDLDARRIVHDAKTAEGGSGAPLFGQSGKVIGVNFGVFTENDASNMALPISFAITLLEQSGWKSPKNKSNDATQRTQTAKIAPETAAKR
ncbi:MAG: trypsin-like peptidase domain-containing protein [Pyrinomonadaceae bacterium]|nr:trypsin-like peptidase domain-containing protein [Pyrinomonadaceae bacterium]